MTDWALDELLRRVMLDAARQECGDLAEGLPEHDFSPEFERKMRKLVCRANHPVWYRAARAAACLLLAALLGGSAVLTVSPDARAAFTGWVREVYETSFIYRFFGTESEASARVLYRPAYVPVGFRTENEIAMHHMLALVYQNDAGELLFFNSSHRDSSFVIQIVREGRETYKQVSVNGMSAELYLDWDEGEANILIWEDKRKGFIFWISSALGEAELIKIAESVEAVPAVYHPTWLPAGYEAFDESSGTPAYDHYLFGDKCINFSVVESVESAAMYVITEEGDTEKRVLVSGYPADLYLGAEGKNSTLIWTDSEEGLAFALITDPEITEAEIIRIAESVQPALTPKQPHRPAWVPAGYILRGTSAGMKNIELHYDKGDGEQILFRYWAAGYAGSLPDELRDAVGGLTPQNTLVNGLATQLYAGADGVNHLVWHDGEADGVYWITAALTGRELIRIAESVGKLP